MIPTYIPNAARYRALVSEIRTRLTSRVSPSILEASIDSALAEVVLEDAKRCRDVADARTLSAYAQHLVRRSDAALLELSGRMVA